MVERRSIPRLLLFPCVSIHTWTANTNQHFAVLKTGHFSPITVTSSPHTTLQRHKIRQVIFKKSNNLLPLVFTSLLILPAKLVLSTMAFSTKHSVLVLAVVCISMSSSVSAYSCSPGHTKIVNAMYSQGLSRTPPDTGGFRSNCDNLVKGKTVKTLFRAIVRSSEYEGKFAPATRVMNGRTFPGEFFTVVNLYKATLGRCPDDSGLQNWVNVLRRKGGPKAYRSIVDAFLNSAEYKKKFGVNLVPNPKITITCPGRPF